MMPTGHSRIRNDSSAILSVGQANLKVITAAGEALGELMEGQPSRNGETQGQRLYIIRGHPEDGDYLCAIEHNQWATSPLHFIWTKDIGKAQVFTEKELETIAPHIVAGYSGTKQIQVEGNQL